MPLEKLIVCKDLIYQEYPVKILDTSEKVTDLETQFLSSMICIAFLP
jgi:hypothetical protein